MWKGITYELHRRAWKGELQFLCGDKSFYLWSHVFFQRKNTTKLWILRGRELIYPWKKLFLLVMSSLSRKITQIRVAGPRSTPEPSIDLLAPSHSCFLWRRLALCAASSSFFFSHYAKLLAYLRPASFYEGYYWKRSENQYKGYGAGSDYQ